MMSVEEWVTMSEAAKRLGVSASQISRLAQRGEIKAETDRLNKRVKLVDFAEVRKLFKESRYYQSRVEEQQEE